MAENQVLRWPEGARCTIWLSRGQPIHATWRKIMRTSRPSDRSKWRKWLVSVQSSTLLGSCRESLEHWHGSPLKITMSNEKNTLPPLAEGSQVGIYECPIVKDQHGSSGRWQDIFVGAKKRPETKHDWEAQCETRCSVNGTDVLWLAGGWRWFSTFQMGSTGMSKRLGPWGWRMSFMLQLLHVVHHVDVRMVVPYRPWGSRWDYHILCRIIVGSWNGDLSLIAPQNKHARDRQHHGCWIYTLASFFWPLCPARDALTWHKIRESALGLTYFHEDGCIIGSLSMKCPPSQVCMSDPRRAPSSTAEVAKWCSLVLRSQMLAFHFTK